MDESVRRYLAEIGRKGGQKSRRRLAPEVARQMVRVREARRAYRRFHAECFWSYRRDTVITLRHIPWVAETLMENGGPEAWRLGRKLCR